MCVYVCSRLRWIVRKKFVSKHNNKSQGQGGDDKRTVSTWKDGTRGVSERAKFILYLSHNVWLQMKMADAKNIVKLCMIR